MQCQDDLANTIDYALLCQQVTEFVSSQSFKLIETVAEQVAGYVKTHFGVKTLTVKVSKPHAVPNAGRIQITLAGLTQSAKVETDLAFNEGV